MGTWQVFATIGLVIAALGIALVLPMGGGTSTSSASTVTTISSPGSSTSTMSTTSSTTSPSTTTTYTATSPPSSSSWPTSTYVDSIQGLQLQLSINTTAAIISSSDATVQVTLSEYNTLSVANNVTKSGDWQVQAALSSCPNTNAQPFGIAIYQGYYTAQNVSQGTQLDIFPPTPCPMYLRLITGYDFQPQSDMAVVLPGSGSAPMTGSVDVNGTYNLIPGGMQPVPFAPTVYTVVAADEWGALAFLHFEAYPGPA